MKSVCFLACLLLSGLSAFSQWTFRVHPDQTDSGYLSSQDSHTVTIDTGLVKNRLLLFITGTGATPDDYQALRDFAAIGHVDVITLSYPNSVAAASLSSDPDSLAFDHFRQEICYGTPLSPDVTVDSLNSIYTRFLKLLQYLAANNTAINWGQYLASPSLPDWSKIVVAGHSQGAGHAAWLGKFHPVERILMFSGPNDYSDYFSAPAHWLSQPGTSPPWRHISYLSLNDEFVDYSKQYANCLALGLQANGDSILVDNATDPFQNSHLLYTVQTPGFVIFNHNVPVKNTAKNHEVWNYMLSFTPLMALEHRPDQQIRLVPNPASGMVALSGLPTEPGYPVSLLDLRGRLVARIDNHGDGSVKMDVSALAAGIYWVRCGTKTVKMVKH